MGPILLLGASLVDIPAGALRRGGGRSVDERPVREVTLSAYRIDATEVDISSFERFTTAGGYRDPQWWSPEGAAWLTQHPELAPN